MAVKLAGEKIYKSFALHFGVLIDSVMLLIYKLLSYTFIEFCILSLLFYVLALSII